VSKGYEAWRHKKIVSFKKCIYVLAHEVTILSELEGVDIVGGAMSKMAINKSRTWSGKNLNGSYK